MTTSKVSDPATVGQPPAAAERASWGNRPLRRDHGIANVFSHGILLTWAALTTFPLLWALASSFKTDRQIRTDPWGLPATLHWENWVRAWNQASIGRYLVNSVLVVSGSLALTMAFGAMAAYVLAR